MANHKKKKKVAPVKKISYEKEIQGPRIIKASYVASAVRPDQYPEGDTVEVAFLGRSNVGKSSLINSLCQHRGLALVSGQPGKTRTINFFTIESKETIDEEHEARYHWFLVDLPGYGYAKASKGNKDRSLWSSFISEYITQSERLSLLCLLIDGRHPEMPIDEEAFNWLVNCGVPLQIVVTKIDKLTSRERQLHMNLIEERYPTGSKPIAYSSLNHVGRTKLTERINEILVEE